MTPVTPTPSVRGSAKAGEATRKRPDDLVTLAERARWEDLIRRAAFAPKGQKRQREAELRAFVNAGLAAARPAGRDVA